MIGEAGVVEVPIADTISAAVEAIMLPDDEPRIPEDSADARVRRSDRGAARQPRWRPPTAEEALRKKPPTPPALADIDEPPDDAGEFSTTSPLRVLFRLMTARATGLLVVAVGGIKKEIYVRDGQPEYVSSNVASELFGNYLVTKGVLSDGELAMALAMMPHYGGKLGDTLVGLGLLKPLEVFRHLTRQVRTKIIDVCTWNKGGFALVRGPREPARGVPARLQRVRDPRRRRDGAGRRSRRDLDREARQAAAARVAHAPRRSRALRGQGSRRAVRAARRQARRSADLVELQTDQRASGCAPAACCACSRPATSPGRADDRPSHRQLPDRRPSSARAGWASVYRAEHVAARPAGRDQVAAARSCRATAASCSASSTRRARPSAIEHPGIVEVYDFGYAHDGSAYIVMELLEGESLEHAAQARPARRRSRRVDRSRRCARALAAAHARGIVHRDLKPDNIFLVPERAVPGGIAGQAARLRHREARRRASRRRQDADRHDDGHAGVHVPRAVHGRGAISITAPTSTRSAASCFTCCAGGRRSSAIRAPA